MHLEVYKNADPEEDFAHFEDQRETNIELLRGLPAETGNRKALHLTAEEMTLSQMLHEWALHDLGTSGKSRSWCGRAGTLAGGPVGRGLPTETMSS